MQIILTEEEYNILKNQADAYQKACETYHKINKELIELKDKYDKLLIHGVVQNNESLKATYA